MIFHWYTPSEVGKRVAIFGVSVSSAFYEVELYVQSDRFLDLLLGCRRKFLFRRSTSIFVQEFERCCGLGGLAMAVSVFTLFHL